MAKTTLGQAQRAARELRNLLETLWAEREAGAVHIPRHELKRLETMVEDIAAHPALADASTFVGAAEAL
jgi:hypothetical protein